MNSVEDNRVLDPRQAREEGGEADVDSLVTTEQAMQKDIEELEQLNRAIERAENDRNVECLRMLNAKKLTLLRDVAGSYAYELKANDYLELWKYFQRKADDVKEAMFKTFTWLVSLQTALLGFVGVKLTGFDQSARIDVGTIVMVSALAGLALCLYAWFALRESGKHIRGNWDRADRCLELVRGLSAIVKEEKSFGETEGRSTWRPSKVKIEIWHQLYGINAVFVVAFLVILVRHMYQPF